MYGLRVSRSGRSATMAGFGSADPTFEPEFGNIPFPDDIEYWQKNPPPKGTTPGAVAVIPSAWDFKAKPLSHYTLQSGDTFVGLSKTYLGDGARWKEIWAVQDGSYKEKRTPDKIFYGDIINMPDEAAANAAQWIRDHGGKAPGGPKLWHYLLGGVLVATVGVGVAYGVTVATKKSHTRALAHR